MGVLILTREQIREVIDMREVIERVRGVYQLKTRGESVIWPLVNYEFEDKDAAMDIRSGYVMGDEAAARNEDAQQFSPQYRKRPPAV